MILVVVVAIAFSMLVTAYVFLRTRDRKPAGPEVLTDFEALAREDDQDANENDEPATDREDDDE